MSEPRRFAGVVARHDGRVVLVREEHPSWGGPFWNLPSGRVEDHETPPEGACRELAEETGLVVAVSDLVAWSTCEVDHPDGETWAWNFLADVTDPALAPADPDGLVLEARWFAALEAADLLRALPYRPLSEPAVAAVTGRLAPGAHWSYTEPSAEPVVTST